MWKITRPDAAAILDNELAKKSLARYFAVMQNKKTAKFMIAKTLAAEFSENDPLETLWKEHEKCTKELHKIEHEIDIGKYVHELAMPSKSFFGGARACAFRNDIYHGLHHALPPLPELDNFPMDGTWNGVRT